MTRILRAARVPGLLALVWVTATIAAADPVDLTLVRSGESYLKPTIALEAGIFSESNAYNGAEENMVGDHVGYWWEHAITGGLEGQLALGDAGFLYGRASAIGTGTNGLDAAGSNFDDRHDTKLEAEDAYVGWKSGMLFPGLGQNAIDLSFGKQKYQIGNGFFMWDGSSDGGERAAFWIAPRKAFYNSAIARLNTRGFKVEAFWLKRNDEPFSDTNVGGANFEYTSGDFGTLGVTYLKIYDSDDSARDDMDFLDWRLDLTPLASDRNWSIGGEFAMEMNGSKSQSYAWYAQTGYSFEDAANKPFLGYRYAFFQRDRGHSQDFEAWDPLFYGFNDWSTWYIGEILGNFVIGNRSIEVHTLRAGVKPSDAVTVQLIYNYYNVVGAVSEVVGRELNPRAANIHTDHIGQSIDLIGDWAANDYLSFSGVIGAFDASGAAKQYFEEADGSWWMHFMLYGKVAF